MVHGLIRGMVGLADNLLVRVLLFSDAQRSKQK